MMRVPISSTHHRANQQQHQQQYSKAPKGNPSLRSSRSKIYNRTDKILIVCFIIAVSVVCFSIFLIPQDMDTKTSSSASIHQFLEYKMLQSRKGMHAPWMFPTEEESATTIGPLDEELKDRLRKKLAKAKVEGWDASNPKNKKNTRGPELDLELLRDHAKLVLKHSDHFQKRKGTKEEEEQQHHHQDKEKNEKNHLEDTNEKEGNDAIHREGELEHNGEQDDTNGTHDENEEEMDEEQHELKIRQERKREEEGTESTTFVPYHMVFSTGCSVFQDWQSFVFFYHAVKAGQEGHITRIISGCNHEQSEQLTSLFNKEIEPMAPGRLHLHFTPNFARIKPGSNFKYYNKPYGMRHWMQHGLGYPDNHKIHDDSIVILLDPDQILLRPFTNDFSNSSEVYRLQSSGGYKTKVEHGSPFAQQYGFGLQWLDKTNMTHILPNQKSPVSTMTRDEARDYYMSMGPPYIATAKDMYSIVTTWCEFVPKVHEDYPHLLAEMFAYNLAAAHLELRHTITYSFMVSDIWAGAEGWKLVVDTPEDDICYNFPKENYPHVIHYCQRYMLGNWFIGKYRLRKDFISCDAPLLKLPPADIVHKYNYSISPSDGKVKNYNAKQVKEMTFMVCSMITALNDASTYYKDQHCDKETANYDQTYVLSPRLQKEFEDELKAAAKK